jgi:hypothetical protein
MIEVKKELRFVVGCVLTEGGQPLSVTGDLMPGQGMNKVELRERKGIK